MATASAPTRPKRADARRNYDRLLATAHDVFTEQGADASLDEIARRAGVGSGTLYRHFPSRDALLEAVVGAAVAGLHDTATDLLHAESPREALVTWLRALVHYVTTFRGLSAALMARQDDEASALHHSCVVIRDAMNALLARAQEAGAVRPDILGDDLGRLVHGVALAAESDQSGATAERLLTLALDGLRSR
jgi:AcrR family transcriptional regulator